MKIKFNSDDDLSLNKLLKFHIMTIIIAAEYYAQNKEAIKEKSIIRKVKESIIRTCHKKKKDEIKEYQRKKYQELVQHKKKALKNK